jgi:hypothetical protein
MRSLMTGCASTVARRFAAAAIAVAAAISSPANAAPLFTASSTSAATVTVTNIVSSGFSFGYYYVQVFGGCGTCIMASAPGGAPLGTFGFSVGSGSFNYLAASLANTDSALPYGSGVYREHFDGYGTVSMPGALPSDASLLGGANNFLGFSLYATPGSNSATIEFDLDQYATSGVVSLPSTTLYLDITGTTTGAVALSALTSVFNTFAVPLTIDFTVTLSDTPFSPSAAGPSNVPEPWTWTVMLAGLAGIWLMRSGGERLVSQRAVAHPV